MKTKLKLLTLFVFLFSFYSNAQSIKELISEKKSQTNTTTKFSEKRTNTSINTSHLIHDYKLNNDFETLEKKYSLVKTNQEYYVDAFIKTNNQVNIDELKSRGVKIFLERKNIFTARIPLNNLENILDLKGILNVELASAVNPLLDNGLLLTGVNQVHEAINLNQSYTGEGVIVGVIDTGFDYTHPTFYDENYTENRISRVWEQCNQNGVAPSINGNTLYGTELIGTSAILNNKKDKINKSHGTHVAGIAAGSGGTQNSNYRGVAYNSEIVLVSLVSPECETEPKPNNWDVFLAIAYIIDYAISVNKPAVINLSLGSHYGPHDGSSYFDTQLDEMLADSGSGYVVVGAAGNEGNKKLHITKNLTPEDDTLFSFLDFSENFYLNNYSPSFVIADNDNINKIIYGIDIWGEVNENFEVAVNIYNTSTSELTDYSEYYSTNTPCSPCLNENEKILYDNDLEPDPIEISIAIEVNAHNNKPHAVILVDNSLQDDTNNKVLIEIKSDSGIIHAWEFINGTGIINFTDFDILGLTDGDSNFTVGEIGGTSNSIISVGAYNSRSCTTMWYNNDNPKCAYEDDLFVISDFSSLGPTIDNRIKPDITAPGNRIISSISSFDNRYKWLTGEFNNEALYSDIVSGITDGNNDWFFGAQQGTSMSAPMVAGIVALMLEANPSLNFSEVKSILQNTAFTDQYTGSSIPDNTWGFGKIDAQAAIQSIEASLSTNNLNFHNFKLYPNPTKDIVNFDNSTVKFETLEVTNLIGQSVLKSNIENLNQTKVDLSGFDKGIYLFKFSSEMGFETYKVIKE